MKIDVTKIDAQMKKLEQLRRLAADPEMLALLETVMVNGNAPDTRGPDSEMLAELTQPGPDRASPLGTLKEGTMVYAVANAALRHEEPFSGYSLADSMIANGYQFRAGKTKPGLVVADIIRGVLVPKKILRVYRKGKGSDPTTYIRY